MTKRPATLPPLLTRFHTSVSKSTLHEALLDLWLEHNGLDVHPDDLTPSQLDEYRNDVKLRAVLRRHQSLRGHHVQD